MTVNGEHFSVDTLKEKSLNALLDYYNLSKNRVAVELNGTVIKKADYDKMKITQEDVIEIIHFVGGGN